MDQTSKHINTTNGKIHSYDQMINMIVNLGSNKFNKYYESYTKLTDLQNSLLMRILTLKKYPMVKENYLQRKCIHTL